MVAYVAYRSNASPPYIVFSSMRFRAVFVSEGCSFFARYSARAAARVLRREGVRCAVFPPEYPHRKLFAQYGVTAPSLAPLYRASAAGITRRYMEQRGMDAHCATVTFAAQSVTPELSRCVETLCSEIRYISLSVPRGGDSLVERLRIRYGVAASSAAPHADITIVVDDTPADGEALCLNDTLGVVFDSEHPNELLAALYLAGALDADALRVSSVTPTAGG